MPAEIEGIVLRRARGDELDRLLELRRRAIRALTPAWMPARDAETWAARPDRAERTRESIEGGTLAVATIGDEVVGWVEVAQDVVHGLYVAPEHAGRGVGSALMDHAEAAILERGFTVAELSAAGPARGF